MKLTEDVAIVFYDGFEVTFYLGAVTLNPMWLCSFLEIWAVSGNNTFAKVTGRLNSLRIQEAGAWDKFPPIRFGVIDTFMSFCRFSKVG